MFFWSEPRQKLKKIILTAPGTVLLCQPRQVTYLCTPQLTMAEMLPMV